MEVIQRIPSLRLLLPLLLGIIIQYYTNIYRWSMIAVGLGLAIILLSFLIKSGKRYNYRYLFGIGVFICLCSIGSISTFFRQEVSKFTFPDISEVYSGTIIDLPQEKPNTILLKVSLSETGKDIVCYLPKNKVSKSLKAGYKITFFGKIKPFAKNGDPDSFDYATFMHNKGFGGQVFIQSDEWEVEEASSVNISMWGSRSRQKIIEYYQSLPLSESEFGVLAALSLGYTDSLSDDVVQSFRATGTAHLLSVSGMHMIIFYTVLWVLTGFFLGRKEFSAVRYWIVMALLWVYVFVIGFPPSAVRACIMLSAFCIARANRLDTYSFNTFFACAFAMLLWNPLWLFDLGFQLSFSAVLSMLLLMPLVLPTFSRSDNQLVRYFANLAVISVVAQIGTLPLCLYYFGVFPSYFFVANLFIIPLFTIIVYVGLLLVGVSLFWLIVPSLTSVLYYPTVKVYTFLLDVLTSVCRFFEQLPFALLQDLKISLPFVFLLWIMFFSFIFFLKYCKPKLLVIGLSVLLLMLGVGIFDSIRNRDSLLVYNNSESPRIAYNIGFKKFDESKTRSNRVINLNGKVYLQITNDEWKNLKSDGRRKDIDYLHIAGCDNISLYSLLPKFNIKKVILDGTLSSYDTKRLASECEKLRIPYYTLRDNGAIRIFF